MYFIKGHPADHLSLADLMSLSAAVRYLGITHKRLRHYMRSAQLSSVSEAYRVKPLEIRTRQWLLRTEVEALKHALSGE
jgi:hypothetical protein